MTIREFVKMVTEHDNGYVLDRIEYDHIVIDGVEMGNARNEFMLTMLMGFTRYFNDEGLLNLSEVANE